MATLLTVTAVVTVLIFDVVNPVYIAFYLLPLLPSFS
jgi:hypothetical protein